MKISAQDKIKACREIKEIYENGKSNENITKLEEYLDSASPDILRSVIKKLSNWQADQSVHKILILFDQLCENGFNDKVGPNIAESLRVLDTSNYHNQIIKMFFKHKDFWTRHYINYFTEDIDYDLVKTKVESELQVSTDEKLKHSLLKAKLSFKNTK